MKNVIRCLKWIWCIDRTSAGRGRTHGLWDDARDQRRNGKQVEAARKFAAEKNVDLRTAELDVGSQESADRAVGQILNEAGRHLRVVATNS